MLDRLNEPVAFFLLIMSIIFVTPLLSERVKLPRIVSIILGGMLIGSDRLGPLRLPTAGKPFLWF